MEIPSDEIINKIIFMVEAYTCECIELQDDDVFVVNKEEVIKRIKEHWNDKEWTKE